jgi:hypothetical protein
MIFYDNTTEGKFYQGIYKLTNSGNSLVVEKSNLIVNGVFTEKNKPKVFLFIKDRFYHQIVETFAIILFSIKEDPDTIFILDLTQQPRLNELDFLFKYLDENNIKYYITNLRKSGPLYVSDFKTYINYQIHKKCVDVLYEMSQKFVKNHKPFRKVYISRAKTINHSEIAMFGPNNDSSKFNFNNDIRLDNDKKMESYFSSLGFEIIYPEDFLNFNDQLIFFNEVKIIAGVTNAGLLNSIFMQPGGIVLELTVPLIVYGTEKIHHQYKGLADVKEHMYLSLFSMRKVDDFIDKIENNKMIKELLLSS